MVVITDASLCAMCAIAPTIQARGPPPAGRMSPASLDHKVQSEEHEWGRVLSAYCVARFLILYLVSFILLTYNIASGTKGSFVFAVS